MMAFASQDLFQEAEQARVGSLSRLEDMLEDAESREVEREEFSTLFALAMRVLELDQETAARSLKTSRPTVSRWESGQSVPHRVARSSVFRELRKLAKERLRQHDLSADRVAEAV